MAARHEHAATSHGRRRRWRLNRLHVVSTKEVLSSPLSFHSLSFAAHPASHLAHSDCTLPAASHHSLQPTQAPQSHHLVVGDTS